ncbi:hypothetical protein VPNG_02679 [Cytospora leucostoma]|uniref:Myb-like domain-containing protein n=1 Tax=Cytospora leucostoma TaxID=1230097 RepID=A0A423XJ58_9PEZI|nr:hypothetical protein VPNG_02679 [Cytospora leucostoma]
MPPKVKAARGTLAASVAPGRQSTRIAAREEAAQQAAEQAAADVPGTAAAATAASPDPSMPPPSTRGIRGGVRDVYTPQRANPIIVSGYDNVEAVQLTPRTQDSTANLMNKFVDGLFSASKALLSHLALEGDHRDDAWRAELQVHKDVFSPYYKIYNLNADVYIDIDTVSARTNAEGAFVWPKMTRAVATANLVNLLSDIEDLEAQPIMVLNRLPLLQRIDDDFPVSFMPGGKQGMESWVVDHDTMDQAFAIRTQRYIETLRGVQKAGTSRLFARVFLDMEVDNMTDDMIGEYIDGAALKGFHGFDINDAQAQEYRNAIAEFRAMLVEMDSNAIISTLEEKYPFQPFLDDLKDWVKTFEANIQGPPSQAPTFNGDGASAANAQLEQENTAAGQGRFTIAGVERLHQHMAADRSAQQEIDERFASQASAFSQFSLANSDRDALQRSGGQQARLLSQAAIWGPDGATYAATAGDIARQGRKRGRKSAADEDAATKRARAADSSAMPPPPRRNPSGAIIPSSSHLASSGAGDLIDPVALSRQSQLISKANRKPAQPKQRKPWTAHDTRELIHAVDTYKAKWSTIERAIKEGHIPFNVPERDQQGLRDKARLTKVDMLKTDAPLPPGFDLVVLGRKEKEMVIAVGRNPERREEHNDPDGVTIHNNFYNPEAPMGDNIEAAVPEDDTNAAAEAEENANIHALQDAPMQPEPHMGGDIPTASMMAPDEEAAPVAAESLGDGEVESQDALAHGLQGSEGSADVPVDDELSEVVPSEAAGAA